jgi:hypothetical protein
MQVHTDFVRTICASIREMLEAVLYKEPRNDFKTGANSADDSDRAPKVPACEFIVAEKGRTRSIMKPACAWRNDKALVVSVLGPTGRIVMGSAHARDENMLVSMMVSIVEVR